MRITEFPRAELTLTADPERPTVSEVTEWLYLAVGGAVRQGDAAAGYPLLRLLDGVGSLLQPIVDLVGDSPDGRVGWSDALDVQNTPDRWWLAQFLGVQSDDPTAILGHAGWRRGTPAAVRAAIQNVLVGAKHVEFFERDGGAYRLTVRTYAVETPSRAAVVAVLDQAVPAGILVDYQVIGGATYAELSNEFATYADLSAQFDSYADMTAYLPPGD
jgi:hypothetical protein